MQKASVQQDLIFRAHKYKFKPKHKPTQYTNNAAACLCDEKQAETVNFKKKEHTRFFLKKKTLDEKSEKE